MPSEEDLLAGYQRGYGPYPSAHSGPDAMALTTGAHTGLIDAVRRYWHVVDGNATIDRVRLKGRVLDVGAGQGQNLEYLVRHGHEAVGLEPNPLAARVCEEKQLPVLCGTLDTVSLEAESFDTVILSQVVEHLVDPGRSLDLVYRVLRPGGTVVIFTPNPGGFQARLFGSDWGHWHIPYHVYLYGPAQLRKLLENSGFTVGRLSTVSPAYWLSMSFQLWKHKSQKTGWDWPPNGIQFHYAIRLAIAPAMRAIDLLKVGDCLVAIGSKA